MATFGDTTRGTGEFPGSDSRCLVSRYQCVGSGTLDSLTTWFGPSTSASVNFKLVVLSDNAGAPDALLAVSDPGVSSGSGGGGPITVAAPSLSLVDGTYYWLGVVADNFPAYYAKDDSGVDALMANGTFSYASPPATWPGTDGTYSGGMNIYATFTEGGGGLVFNPLSGRGGGAAQPLAG